MRAAVIPTQNREDLADCMNALRLQVDHIILIAHNVEIGIKNPRIHVIEYTEEIPNISVMWNLGLEVATYLQVERVAVINDDAIVPAKWFDNIESAMLKTGACAGWAQGSHDGHLIYRKAEPTMRRMTGYAFVINEAFRADEQFQWWGGDQDLEWRAREHTGVVQVGGDVEHRHPNASTVGILARIAGQDRERFRAKWGMYGW